MPRPTLGLLDQVAEMLADGLSTAEIAQRLGKTPAQTNACVQRIRQALGSQAR